jgi:hypothetical protein
VGETPALKFDPVLHFCHILAAHTTSHGAGKRRIAGMVQRAHTRARKHLIVHLLGFRSRVSTPGLVQCGRTYTSAAPRLRARRAGFSQTAWREAFEVPQRQHRLQIVCLSFRLRYQTCETVLYVHRGGAKRVSRCCCTYVQDVCREV